MELGTHMSEKALGSIHCTEKKCFNHPRTDNSKFQTILKQ